MEYILAKDCPDIDKRKGDYYDNEFDETIEYLLLDGTIMEEVLEVTDDPTAGTCTSCEG